MMKKLVLFIFCTLLFNNVYSQQIAKAKAINSLETILSHMKMENPSEDIYDNIWNNRYVDCYKNLTINESKYVIDLRDFCMPISKSKIRIISNYGYRHNRKHRGIDLDLNVGDTIYACFSGKTRISKVTNNDYGKYVVIRHFNGLETIYAHMSKIFVKENTYVYAGEPIGLGGNTGRSTGPHLHLEILFCGMSINPINIFNFNYQDVTDDTYIFLKN